jgi:hypothetical protein
VYEKIITKIDKNSIADGGRESKLVFFDKNDKNENSRVIKNKNSRK